LKCSLNFLKIFFSANIVRPRIIKNKRQIQFNKARVQGHGGVAFVLNQNLQEVRQKNLLNKREIIRKPLMKKVRLTIFNHFFF